MCGIAGFAGSESHDHARRAVAAMVATMARRGPDGECIESWPGAVLGHRRLAILDLSDAGRQPMLSDDGQVGVVFNGCIYNFQDLRADLEAHGHRFRSHCDTEVLVRGYQQWGIDRLVQRLRGMFAFGIWDNARRKLTLVRDRLGVKPLVYAMHGRSIAFASTVTALRQVADAEIDPAAVLEFLEWGWVSDNRAIFAGMRKVPAASVVEWQDGKLQQREYWTLPPAGSQSITFDEAVERTETLLLEASKLRLISDVPVGALLSGGIDSALICWAMAKLGADIKAYTVSTPGDPADEAEEARATARAVGIDHEIIELPPNEPPALDDLTCAYGEPFACPSALAMLRVCKAVKPSVTVLLTGDGGDDVYLGYEHHRTFWMAQRLSRFVPGKLAGLWHDVGPAVIGVPPLRRGARLLDYASGGLGAVTQAHDGLPYFRKVGLLGERLAGIRLEVRAIPRSLDSAKCLMNEFLDYERRSRFVAEYMTKVDGGAMYHGIEARSPLLDQDVWNFAAGLPFHLRLRRGELKAVLREVVRRNIGQQTAKRSKKGFTVPIGRWLATVWRPQLDTILDGSVLEEQGWVGKGALAGAVRTAIDNGRAPLQLWSLVVLEQWFRRNAAEVAVTGR